MGKRARRRGVATEPVAPAPRAAAPRRSGRPRPEDRPKPPWHPVPLVELSVLVGIVLLVLGAINLDEDRGKLMLVLGMGLGSLGGLDTALREHFAGYRSHTTIIAALPAVVTAAALFFAQAPWLVLIGAAAIVFAVVFWFARKAFMRRAKRALRSRS
jgi:hypothetical protein